VPLATQSCSSNRQWRSSRRERHTASQCRLTHRRYAERLTALVHLPPLLRCCSESAYCRRSQVASVRHRMALGRTAKLSLEQPILSGAPAGNHRKRTRKELGSSVSSASVSAAVSHILGESRDHPHVERQPWRRSARNYRSRRVSRPHRSDVSGRDRDFQPHSTRRRGAGPMCRRPSSEHTGNRPAQWNVSNALKLPAHGATRGVSHCRCCDRGGGALAPLGLRPACSTIVRFEAALPPVASTDSVCPRRRPDAGAADAVRSG